MKEAHLKPAPKARPKLDPRLTILEELGEDAFAGAGVSEQESMRDPLIRSGSLAFLRSPSQREAAFIKQNAVAEPRLDLPATVPVFLHAKSEEALTRLAAKGARIISRARTIATAEVPISRDRRGGDARGLDIAALEKDDDVVAIEWTGAVRPLSEARAAGGEGAYSALAAIGIDPAKLGDLDGRGCVIGIIDVEGLDVYHPSFVTRSGRTRVRAIWDQRAKPVRDDFNPPEIGPGGLGVVYRRAAIDAEIRADQPQPGAVVPHRAIKGSHGTQTAGFAHGSGVERADARGVAPGAELVFVSTWSSGSGALGAMTELADAIAFVMAEAEAAGMPCVVNISLGDDLGPRDGTSPVERFIDELLEKDGRVVVVAAGNAQGKQRNATATLEDGGEATFELVIAPRNTERAVVEIWCAGDTALTVDVGAPEGGGWSGPVAPDGVPRVFDGAETRALVVSMERYPGSPNAMARVEILPLDPSKPIAPGAWQIRVRARGKGGAVHAWVDHRYAHWKDASDTLTLTTPATARRAIVVGACDPGSGEQAWFSGGGTDRGGVARPDILAPGVSIVASWASSPVRYVESACGTSVAAPIVAGVAALVLQQGGSMPWDRARERVLSLVRGDERCWAEGVSSMERVAAPSPSRVDDPRGGGAVPARARPGDTVQIIEGHYRMFVEKELVGELLVLPGDRPGVMNEYWALGPGYRPPSAQRPDTTLEIRYLGAPITQRRFRARLPAGTRLVLARCELTDPPKKTLSATHRGRHEGVETMEGAFEMTTKNYMSPSDKTQIIEGRYNLHQDDVLVGMLLVTDDAPLHSTEHWLLYESYRWPSQANPQQGLRFTYLGVPCKVGEFLAAAPPRATYVVARCEQQTLS